ncbi:hypothetical protein LJC11_03300, partial [Bacteroidales bacterium OttesenSCG-928-I21]|nr:hypothetical protein [Bacteroidales bacterium OttesenSCG-928-I21]
SNDFDYTTLTRASGNTYFFVKYVGDETSKNVLYRNIVSYKSNSTASKFNELTLNKNTWVKLDNDISTNSSGTSSGLGKSELEKRQYIFTPSSFVEKYFYRFEFMISGDYLNSDAKVAIYVERISM